MDVVENPLDITLESIISGLPLYQGNSPYKHVTYSTEENLDYYTPLLGKTLREKLEERIDILKQEYKEEETAVLLSGGIDSSIATLLWKPKEVWTLNNNNSVELNENKFAVSVANKIGAKINFIDTNKGCRSEYELIELISNNGILSRHSGLFALDLLMESIKKAGYKNILIGSYADYCFGHFKVGIILELQKLFFQNELFAPYRSLFQKVLESPDRLLCRLFGVSPTAINSKPLSYASPTLANDLHLLMGEFDRQEEYNECFLERRHGLTLIDPYKSQYIEEYAFSYNKQLDYTNGVAKSVLKAEFADILPKEVLMRTHKIGCSVPYWKWFEIQKGNYEQLIIMFLTWHLNYWAQTDLYGNKSGNKITEKILKEVQRLLLIQKSEQQAGL